MYNYKALLRSEQQISSEKKIYPGGNMGKILSGIGLGWLIFRLIFSPLIGLLIGVFQWDGIINVVISTVFAPGIAIETYGEKKVTVENISLPTVLVASLAYWVIFFSIILLIAKK